MTREEAKKRLEVWLICGDCPEDKQCYDSYLHSTCEYTDYCDDVPIKEAIKVAIKALEQEPILDKIRAEIEAHPKTYPFVNHINAYIKASDCLNIIDKYKAASEE